MDDLALQAHKNDEGASEESEDDASKPPTQYEVNHNCVKTFSKPPPTPFSPLDQTQIEIQSIKEPKFSPIDAPEPGEPVGWELFKHFQ